MAVLVVVVVVVVVALVVVVVAAGGGSGGGGGVGESGWADLAAVGLSCFASAFAISLNRSMAIWGLLRIAAEPLLIWASHPSF